MLRWYVVVLAAVAVILLVAGLVALVLPEEYEGRDVYHFDPRHSVRVLDVLGVSLLCGGCALAWLAGALWQRNVHAS